MLHRKCPMRARYAGGMLYASLGLYTFWLPAVYTRVGAMPAGNGQRSHFAGHSAVLERNFQAQLDARWKKTCMFRMHQKIFAIFETASDDSFSTCFCSHEPLHIPNDFAIENSTAH